jgi:PAS domain S-box-containing protein
MPFHLLLVPSQTIIPLGVALAHLVLISFVIYRRRFKNFAFPWLFNIYLLLTALWNLILILVVSNQIPLKLPLLDWMGLGLYGLIGLGIFYGLFARSFLQLSWQSSAAWLFYLIGLGGLAVVISLNGGWLVAPAEALAWSDGWLHPANLSFVISVLCWDMLMILTFFSALLQLRQTQGLAHKNRIKYLLLATVVLVVGYGLYLTLLEPLWAVGLIIISSGNLLTGYIVTVENLMDLSTGARRVVRQMFVIGVTLFIYLTGIYLVQIFLGDFLASTFLAQFLDPILPVAAVTAILLTIVYPPITRASRTFIDRILFGHNYDFQSVIQDYTQSISNILYLDDLAVVSLKRIKETLGIAEGVLFLLEETSGEKYCFRTLPYAATRNNPANLGLNRNKPIYNRLVSDGRPLAQYTLDISPHFDDTPEEERQTLKKLKAEWYIPILKKQDLIGIFALGSKISGHPYNTDELRLLTTMADQTALALDNAHLVDRLQQNFNEITRMKNLMDNVFDSMDSGVITTDLRGKITLFNKAAESILGLPPADESIGRPYTEALPWLARTFFPNLVRNALERDDHYPNYDFIFDLPDRGRVDLMINLAPLKDVNDRTQGVTMVIDDRTETKRLQAVQAMFRRYVSPAVVDRLPADPSKLELGGHRQQVSVLFADIRGFTTFSEKLQPEKLVDILNEYLSMAAASILMYEGTLDKFMGDAVMGIFNAPLAQEDHTLRAVRAALAMQKAIADYHKNIGQERGLAFGVGIHVGEAVVGNVGMSDRMDYTAIGDTVNLAKRIQENTPGNKILISDDVYRIVNGTVKAKFFKEMQVKGRAQPVKTYELHIP